VKQACRPILASARIRKFVWRNGELFEADIFILNDSTDCVKEGKLEVFIIIGNEKNKIYEWDYQKSEAHQTLWGLL